MRNEYDFPGGVRRRVPKRARPVGVKTPDDDATLTQGQIRELRRRVADLKDPVRYLIVADFGRRFALYYNVTDDVYVLNEPARATLFKRRRAAAAVKALLGGGTRIIRCTTTRGRKGVWVRVLAGGAEGWKARAKK